MLSGQDKYDEVIERVKNMDDIFWLSGLIRPIQERIKKIAAEVLKQGSDEPIEQDQLGALDYIWGLPGDGVFGTDLPNKRRAIEYYEGRTVIHVWGEGTIEKDPQGVWGIKVIMPCRCGKDTGPWYARPGLHTGAFAYLDTEDGKHTMDIRNHEPVCSKCSEREK